MVNTTFLIIIDNRWYYITIFYTFTEAIVSYAVVDNNQEKKLKYDCNVAEKSGLLSEIERVEQIGDRLVDDMVSLTRLDSYVLDMCGNDIQPRAVFIPNKYMVDAKKSVITVSRSEASKDEMDDRKSKHFFRTLSAFYKRHPQFVQG